MLPKLFNTMHRALRPPINRMYLHRLLATKAKADESFAPASGTKSAMRVSSIKLSSDI